jgi:hypothetical protein
VANCEAIMLSSKSSRRRRRKLGTRFQIGEQFVHYPISMLKAETFRSLSLSERKILHRLEIEHACHGGKHNGALTCTYTDFIRYGVRKGSIANALNRLEDRGFIEIVRGRMAFGDLRVPSKYRLTYLPTYQGGNWIPSTNEWRKKQKTAPQNGASTAPQSGTRKADFPHLKTEPSPHLKTEVLSISRGGGVGDCGTGEQPKSSQPPLPTGEAMLPPLLSPGLTIGSSVVVIPTGETLQ